MKLFLKGERCHSEKCAIERRNFPPRAAWERPEAEDHWLSSCSFMEEAKVRRAPACWKRSSVTCSRKQPIKRVCSQNLLGSLEQQLDDVIYRMGFGTSQARQICPHHGHIQVNGRKVNIPSFQVRRMVATHEVREGSKKNPTILSAKDAKQAHTPVPNWLEVDRETLRGRVMALPQRSELVQIQINEQQIVELYPSKQGLAASRKKFVARMFKGFQKPKRLVAYQNR